MSSGWKHISLAFVDRTCAMLKVAAEDQTLSATDLRAIMRQAEAMIRAAIAGREAEQLKEEEGADHEDKTEESDAA
jgi:hypothetical protein